MERIRINLLNALRNGYGFKTAAIVERFKAYLVTLSGIIISVRLVQL